MQYSNRNMEKLSKQTLGRLAQGLSLLKSIGQFIVAKPFLACSLEPCPSQFLQLLVQDEAFLLPHFPTFLTVIPFNRMVS